MPMFLTVAVRNLLQARRRSLLLGVALAAVTAMLVLLQALSTGLTDNIVHSATVLATGHVNVAGFYKTTPDDSMPVVTEQDKVREVVEANTPGLAYVIDRHRGWAKLVSDTASTFAGPSGIDPAQETRLARTLIPARERDYVENGSEERKGDLSRLGEPKSIVLFASQAKKLGVVIGDEVTLTSQSFKGAANSASATIVGIAEDIGLMSMWAVFVPKDMLRDLYQLREDTTGALQVYLQDIEQAPAVAQHLRKVFEEKGWRVMDPNPVPFFQKFESVSAEDWTGQKLDMTTWEDEVSFVKWIVNGFDAVTLFLISILLVIIAVGIMNTMWISVRERTGEIGTLRAIGMSRRRVLAMFLAEAAILGLVATTAGGLFGALVALGIDAAGVRVANDAVRTILLSDTVRMGVDVAKVVGAIAGFTLVTGLAAMWPAFRASRLQPVTAIQSVT